VAVIWIPHPLHGIRDDRGRQKAESGKREAESGKQKEREAGRAGSGTQKAERTVIPNPRLAGRGIYQTVAVTWIPHPLRGIRDDGGKQIAESEKQKAKSRKREVESGKRKAGSRKSGKREEREAGHRKRKELSFRIPTLRGEDSIKLWL
jgi:hypothetical protein